MIETLTPSNRAEVIETVGEAFSQHPMLPVDSTGRASRRMITALMDGFVAATDAHWFGIRRDGRLACAAFVFDASFEPRGWALAVMLFRFVRLFGPGMLRTFHRVMAAKPKRDERQLELLILGTHSEHQQQGLGREMMRHVFEFARQRGYASVVLEVAKGTAAQAFYFSEGYEQEREVELPKSALCLLRRPL